jgi:carboxyl-terminal processing protease
LETRRVRPWLALAVAAPWVLAFLSPLHAAALPSRLQDVYEKGRQCEEKGQWADACGYYDQVLRVDRDNAEVREHLQTCLRHVHLLRRHRDESFTKTVLNRKLPEALDVYEEVLTRLQASFVERDKVQISRLFQKGLQELRFALEDETFLQEHLPAALPERVRAFAAELDEWSTRDVQKVRDAREQARAVAVNALDVLGLNPTVAVLEFACGACNALDEYSVYLTPSQLQYVQAALRGEYVGVGIRVGVADHKLVVTSVVGNSPAGEKGLKPGDRILRIDGQPADDLSAEVVSHRLLGRAGTPLELEVLAAADMMSHTVRLLRQPVVVPSVEFEPMLREGVGYVRILTFQETTPQELKDAILQLQALQLKALVLDLRGNTGGSFRASVQVAEMFLTEGTIVLTESPIRRFRNTHKASNPNALTLPLVVLVDGDTASASEVLAGALKENGRATLVGTATFGKGSLQYPLALDTVPSGIWVTVAKYFSTTNQPYNGRGVTPDLVVADDMMGAQRHAAWQAAQQLAMMSR